MKRSRLDFLYALPDTDYALSRGLDVSSAKWVKVKNDLLNMDEAI